MAGAAGGAAACTRTSTGSRRLARPAASPTTCRSRLGAAARQEAHGGFPVAEVETSLGPPPFRGAQRRTRGAPRGARRQRSAPDLRRRYAASTTMPRRTRQVRPSATSKRSMQHWKRSRPTSPTARSRTAPVAVPGPPRASSRWSSAFRGSAMCFATSIFSPRAYGWTEERILAPVRRAIAPLTPR